MKFKLDFDIPHHELFQDFGKVYLLGSCFAENQAKNFHNSGFSVESNPYGIQYNPFSISQILSRVANDQEYKLSDLIEFNTRWFSLENHGSFEYNSEDNALRDLNDILIRSKESIKESDVVIISLGTSLVFRHTKRNQIVANNHKIPSSEFVQEFLSPDDTLRSISEISKSLKAIQSNLKIVWTISPVRHVRSGLEKNFLSKSNLRQALHEHLKSGNQEYYFPAYEIFMDELRDYRFSAEDLAHPNAQAVDYIWERFTQTYFSNSLRKNLEEVEAFRKFESHKPRNREEEHLNEVKRWKKELETKFENISL